MSSQLTLGIPILDTPQCMSMLTQALSYPINTGDFGIVAGTLGVGTTLLLLQFCSVDAGNGGVPLFITPEVPAAQLRHRFARQQQGLGTTYGTIAIVDRTLCGGTVDDIEQIIRAWHKPDGTRHLVCVDKLERVSQPGSMTAALALQRSADALAALALKYDIAIFTTVGVTREAHGRRELTVHDIAWNSHVQDSAALVIGMSPWKDENGKVFPGEYNLQVLKSRYTGTAASARMLRNEYLILLPVPASTDAHSFKGRQ